MNRPAGELSAPNPIAAMLQSHIEKGGTVESAGALAKLYMEMEEFTAKKEFARAFAELQEAIPPVIANGRNEHLGTAYAQLEDMQDAINPLAKAHGLSITFDSRYLPNGMLEVDCIATHKYSGHSEKRSATVRVGGSPNKAVTITQTDVGALKTAKRCALANMFNLKIEYDNEARLLGEFITPEQASALEARVAATGRDRGRFLKLAAAEDFAQIRTGKHAMLDSFLTKAERSKPADPGEISEAEKAAILAREQKEMKQ